MHSRAKFYTAKFHDISLQIWIFPYFSGVQSDQKHFSGSPYHEKHCLGTFQNQSNTKEHTNTLEFQSKCLLKPICVKMVEPHRNWNFKGYKTTVRGSENWTIFLDTFLHFFCFKISVFFTPHVISRKLDSNYTLASARHRLRRLSSFTSTVLSVRR